MVVSDGEVSYSNEKDCRYIVGYQVDGAMMPLFIKTPKNTFSYGVSQHDKMSQMSGCLSTKIFGMRLGSICLKN